MVIGIYQTIVGIYYIKNMKGYIFKYLSIANQIAAFVTTTYDLTGHNYQ